MQRKDRSGIRVGRASLLLTVVALTLHPSDAHAYIDPGTGSMAYQALLALALGVGMFFRQIRARVMAAFRAQRAGHKEPRHR